MEKDTSSHRADGGLDTLEPPPPECIDGRTLDPATLAQNASRLASIVHLLNQPALARLYVFVCYWGPATPPTITETLDLSKSTTYEYIDRLVQYGLIERDDTSRPQQLTAEPLIVVEQTVPIVITPTVLHALSRQEVDDDVAYFVDRHGVGTLVAALRGAGLHAAGAATQRMVASDIDVRDTEAMLILAALEPVLKVGYAHDPYFEYLFPDVGDQMDVSGSPGRDLFEQTRTDDS